MKRIAFSTGLLALMARGGAGTANALEFGVQSGSDHPYYYRALPRVA